MLDEQGRHFPKDPNRFEFDAEVSEVFETMAEKAIPNFWMAHRMHVKMLLPMLHPGMRILDIGASRGSFYKALREEHTPTFKNLELHASDMSPEMCAYMRVDFPTVQVWNQDVTSLEFLRSAETYDVVCLHYVLQFIRPEHQWTVLNKAMSMVRRRGYLVFGHKSAHHEGLGEQAHKRYIELRIGNGYSREEIEAKTKALQNSMFPMEHDEVVEYVRKGNFHVQETTRFMMFCSFMAQKMD